MQKTTTKENFKNQQFGTLIHSYCFNQQLLVLGQYSIGANTKSIRLNTDLAKKPPECLEYIVVHEMAHLLEPTHNSRFITLMDQFMPKWRFYKEELNRLPVRHESWDY